MKSTYPLILSTVSTIVVFLSFEVASPKEYKAAAIIYRSGFKKSQDPTLQPQTKRIWGGEIKNQLFSIGTEGNKLTLFKPTRIATDGTENIYVLDFDDRSVKKFSKDGKYMQTFGYGRGKGPGELTNPTDFDIGPDGSVWVCDPINGYITVFNSSGAVAQTIRLTNATPLRIAITDETHFVVMSSETGKYLFTTHDRKGKLVGRFGDLFDNQPQLSIALDGTFARGGTNYFVFAFYRIGVFVVYEHGSLTPSVFAQTINYKGFPALQRFEVGNSRITRIDRKAPYATLSASIVDNEVHLLIEDGESNKSVFDIYDLKTGLYRQSYSLPSDVSYAHVTAQRIYTIRDTTVSVWSR